MTMNHVEELLAGGAVPWSFLRGGALLGDAVDELDADQFCETVLCEGSEDVLDAVLTALSIQLHKLKEGECSVESLQEFVDTVATQFGGTIDLETLADPNIDSQALLGEIGAFPVRILS